LDHAVAVLPFCLHPLSFACFHPACASDFHFSSDAKSRCPHVELVEVSGADHHVTRDNLGGFVDAVIAWLG
jgi:hypothetical protein